MVGSQIERRLVGRWEGSACLKSFSARQKEGRVGFWTMHQRMKMQQKPMKRDWSCSAC